MIISASFRSDIPSHPAEFINNVRAGFFQSKWSKQIILIKDVDAFVLWTKNIGPMLDFLPELRSYAPVLLLHTITGYGKELEANLPEESLRVQNLREASNILGQQAVVWRFDPIILLKDAAPAEDLSYAGTIRRFTRLAEQLQGSTSTCVFSFLTDEYPKVSRRLTQGLGRQLEYPLNNRVLPLFGQWRGGELMSSISSIAAKHGMILKSCGHGNDFSEYGVKQSACIDASYFSELGISSRQTHKRAGCGCVASVDIGTYNTCRNGCLYCYARS